jgi:mercuric ion transport protein
MLRKLGGYILTATALLACPCHLPLTAGLVLAALSGTALGQLLTDNLWLLFLASSVLFLAALAAAFWLLGRQPAADTPSAAREAPPRDAAARQTYPPAPFPPREGGAPAWRAPSPLRAGEGPEVRSAT